MKRLIIILSAILFSLACHALKPASTENNQVILNNTTGSWHNVLYTFIFDGYYPLSDYIEAENSLNDFFIETHGLKGARVYVERLWDNDRKVYVEIDLGQPNYWPEDKVFNIECNLFKFVLTQKALIVEDIRISKSGSLARASATITLESQTGVFYNLYCNGIFVEQNLGSNIPMPVTQEGEYTVEACVYNLDEIPATLAQGPIPMSRSVSFFLDEVEEVENAEVTLSQTQNYIAHFVSHDGSASSGSLTAQYYDGLGRPHETVRFAATPTKKDLVTYQEYDALGRKSSTWLPTVVSGNNGAFIYFSNLKKKASNMYIYEPAPYTLSMYEASPLNRILEQYGPGRLWHLDKRSIKTTYMANIAGNDTLNCIHYAVTDHVTIDTIMTVSRTGNYATNQLYVTRTADEDNNTSFEFKNKLGQVVLIRQLNGAAKECYDTYYIYDDFGNLKVVLPPMAADAMKAGTSWTSNTDATLKEYAYLYRYDNSNRCIVKKLPGAGCTRNIYDKSNRLIFTQDAKKQWSFSIPDSLGRIVLTGTFKTINGSSNILNSDYENSLVVASFAINGAHNYYTIRKDAGTLILDTVSYLITNYYDNYDFMGQSGFSGLTYSLPIGADSGFNTRDTNANAAKTLLTGSITGDADGGATKIYSAMYYDYRGHIIQSRSTNHLGGTEVECFIYSFTGKPEKRLHIHKKTNSSSEVKELYTYTYDHAERLLTTTHQLNDGTVVTLAETLYDDLGRLKTKKHHGIATNIIVYTYNIRNWITGISSTRFTQNLYYNHYNINILNTRLYNGNVSSMTWKTGTETTLRGYKFVYDNLNRLKEANYGEGESITTNTGRFTEKVTGYDKHGNITGLQRHGKISSSGHGLIDNLSFGYVGNQMKYVNDAVTTNPVGQSFQFVNGSSSTGDEYTYDANGNMTKDLNKNITDIQYNLLNLPKKLQLSSGGVATYTYDAAGVKRKVEHQGAGENKTTDYCGNVIYENGALSKILTEEGYITLSGTTPTYHYYLKDHLGNNRVVLNQNGSTVEQVNHYYPFGGLFDQTSESLQAYKYNGKELDRTYGIDLYDYSARFMDGAVGRFTTMDPLSEKYYSVSPYLYCGGNPVIYIDPDGKEKLIALNPNDPRNASLINAANKYEDDGAIHVWAHGNSTTIFAYDSQKRVELQIKTGKGLESFLNENSQIWENRSEDTPIKIILHSCETGQESKENMNPIARQISKELKNTVVIAPSGKVAVDKNNNEIGSYSSKTVTENGISKTVRDKEATWNIYSNNKRTGGFPGSQLPKENMPKSFMEKLSDYISNLYK